MGQVQSPPELGEIVPPALAGLCEKGPCRETEWWVGRSRIGTSRIHLSEVMTVQEGRKWRDDLHKGRRGIGTTLGQEREVVHDP